MTAELSDIFRDSEALRIWHDVSLVLTGAAVNLIGGAAVAVAALAYERYKEWDRERRFGHQGRSVRKGMYRI